MAISRDKRNLTRENLDMAKKRKLKNETESLLVAAQNNTIRTNYVQERIDKVQQNSRSKLCGNRGETINHIISECKVILIIFKENVVIFILYFYI